MPVLRLHDSSNRSKRDFVPLDASHVRLYACGPTVHDLAHLGNARPVVAFDVLVRLLRSLYPKVAYARNVTDVDDKIIEASRRTGEDMFALTTRLLGRYRDDMATLGNLPPDVEPLATAHIPQMIALTRRLLERRHAYEVNGEVLFETATFPEYGRLSGRKPAELRAGARVAVTDGKRGSGDFVLWKPSADDEPGWDSPWGRGRPGWHLECSAMSAEHLGETFDIHGGGHDLLFPHHENEVAQSRCAHGTAMMAAYWMHVGMLRVDGAKMSKSLGNFVTVHDLTDGLPDGGMALRLLMLGTHYRAALDFTRTALERATADLREMRRVVAETPLVVADPRMTAWAAAPLFGDLNTPLVLTRLRVLRDLEVRSLDGAVLWHSEWGNVAPGTAAASLREVAGGLLGLDFVPQTLDRNADVDAEVERLLTARTVARQAGDWAVSDALRGQLSVLGITVKDGKERTAWTRT